MIFLELFTAAFGCVVLWLEAWKNQSRNYVTSVFLACFVPLLCIYPVIARLFVGGALSVVPGSLVVISGYETYLIFQLFTVTILATIFLSRRKSPVQPELNWREKYQAEPWEIGTLFAAITLGVILFVRSTGFSALDLISASRFEWFNNASYSPTTFVISTYLISLTPIALILILSNPKYRWVAVILTLEMILYGLMSKDRKWLIFMISAATGYWYIANSQRIVLKPKFLVLSFSLVLLLSFYQVIRGVLFTYALTGSGDIVYESQQMALDLLTRGDFPYYYNASITALEMNYYYDYWIPFALLRRQLLFFLPAGWSFGLKLEDISALFSDVLGAGDATRRGNMPPGFFGLFVLSFKWGGAIVACAAFPLLLRWLDGVIQRNRNIWSIVLLSQILSSMFLLLRGDDSSASYYIFFSFLFFALVRLRNFLPARGAAVPPYG